jgi:hypothetical protein
MFCHRLLHSEIIQTVKKVQYWDKKAIEMKLVRFRGKV